MDIPPWAILLPNGQIVEPTKPGEQPTRYLEEPGSAIAFPFSDGRFYMVAASPESKVDWLTTVEAPLQGGGGRRLLGPGIRSTKPVRLWLDPGRPFAVMADGPVELASEAIIKFQAAAKERTLWRP